MPPQHCYHHLSQTLLCQNYWEEVYGFFLLTFVVYLKENIWSNIMKLFIQIKAKTLKIMKSVTIIILV